MKDTLVTARQDLADKLEQLASSLRTHQELTARAVELELAMIKRPDVDDASYDRRLVNQQTGTSILREALYELENIVLRLKITVQLFNNLSRLNVETAEELPLITVKATISKLCILLDEFPKVASQCEQNGFTEKSLKQMDETLSDANDIFRKAIAAIEQTDNRIHGVYKESLTNKAVSIDVASLSEWLLLSQQVVTDLELYTTTQREDLMLWQKRTEYAYTNDDAALASKAWQRRKEYGLALAKIEEALVIHVEVSALAKQRLNN